MCTRDPCLQTKPLFLFIRRLSSLRTINEIQAGIVLKLRGEMAHTYGEVRLRAEMGPLPRTVELPTGHDRTR
jgi:hypothetical protein